MAPVSAPVGAELAAAALSFWHGAPAGQRELATALPYLSLIRFDSPTALNAGMLEPSMCLLLQGRKKVLIGAQVTQYGAGDYLLSAIGLPISGQVVQASPALPYLGLKLRLEPKEIAALIVDHGIAPPRRPPASAGAYVGRASLELHDAFLRLLRLLDKPPDLAMLAPLLKQEILYRLLSGPDGAALYHGVLSQRQERGVNQAIQWIREHFAEPMSIDALAASVGMSASNLHHRFKAITVMSPLQYQKRVRLLEARRLLLGGNMEAASVAFAVGYESPSQFGREYRRLFGATPLRDAGQLQHAQFAP